MAVDKSDNERVLKNTAEFLASDAADNSVVVNRVKNITWKGKITK